MIKDAYDFLKLLLVGKGECDFSLSRLVTRELHGHAKSRSQMLLQNLVIIHIDRPSAQTCRFMLASCLLHLLGTLLHLANGQPLLDGFII